MRLLKRINILFLITSLIVMLCLGTALTIVLNNVIEDEANDILKHSYRRIASQIEAGERVNTLWPYFEIDTVPFHNEAENYSEVWIKSYKAENEVGRNKSKSFRSSRNNDFGRKHGELNKAEFEDGGNKSKNSKSSHNNDFEDKHGKFYKNGKEGEKFGITKNDDKIGNDNQELFIQLTAFTTIRSVTYSIVVRTSKLDSDDFNESVILVVLLSLAFVVIIMAMINRKISSSLWHGFYQNLLTIKNFSVQHQQPIALKKSNITEINELNSAVENLTNIVISDYKNLKQFSEDASHEFQTPLAIIRSKLESLINCNGLSDSQLEKLDVINKTVNRLTRLNKELLLLTKIENHQFDTQERVSFNTIVQEKISDWQEIVALKNIEILFETDGEFVVVMNHFLAETIVSNLLSNAINHTDNEGKFVIRIAQKTMLFSNSGNNAIANPQSVFNRFHKENSSSQSVGLGLAIVQKICEANNLTISYRYNLSMHCFEVSK